MKRIVKIAIALSLALSMPISDSLAITAQNGQYNGYRGGSQNRNSNNQGSRPNSNNAKPNGTTNKPNGTSGRHNGTTGKPNGTSGRPNGAIGRPNSPTNRPGNIRPPQPTQRPNPGSFRPLPPPSRPNRPLPRPVYCPNIPGYYTPYRYAPILSTVLGLNFGVTISSSINLLNAGGYYIDGYNNNEVYLRNVYNMNYTWNDAILYYNAYGQLANVCFYYSSASYDRIRYNDLYYTLCRDFGSPAIQNQNGVTVQTSWLDRTGNHFITLSFDYGTSFGGTSRYYTTLTFGTN